MLNSSVQVTLLQVEQKNAQIQTDEPLVESNIQPCMDSFLSISCQTEGENPFFDDETEQNPRVLGNFFF
jgi:hypothetical protein